MKELVIISGKGGTGKTSLTASFAALAKRPVIVDCDVDAADLHLILAPQTKAFHEFYSGHEATICEEQCIGCGTCATLCRFEAIRKNKNSATFFVDPIACEGCGVCVRFCPVKAIDFPERMCGQWMLSETRYGPMVHAKLGVAAENSGKLVAQVRNEAQRIAVQEKRSLVIVDGPPGIGCPVIASIAGTTQVLVITEPTVSGESDLERALSLTQHFCIPTAICVNKWDLNPEMTSRIEKKASERGAQVLGRIRYDRNVTQAQIQEKAIVEMDTPCAEDVQHVWKQISNLDNKGQKMECAELNNVSLTVRDHAMNARNYGPLEKFNGHAGITGPCGDTMEFWVSVSDEKIDRIAFITDGCGPSRASGSMATTLVAGKCIRDAFALQQQDILNALGGLPANAEHCALLAVNTLQAACRDFLNCTSDLQHCENATNGHACKEKNQSDNQTKVDNHPKLESRLCRIRHKVVVLSGKGGVGKSTVAVNLAVALMLAGKRVGLLDVDIHGPSIPTMLGVEREKIQSDEQGLYPIKMGNLKVMSLGFLLSSQDDAVIWRGPMKMSMIKQFLEDVVWDDLDYLIIDSPPGTGDEPLSVCQLIGNLDGAVIVTTPQKVAAVDVRKSVTFCRQLQVPVLGIVENMNGFVCPKCGEVTSILPTGGGKQIAEDMKVPFLGSIPMDPQIAEACDAGQAFVHHYSNSPTARIMRSTINSIVALDKTHQN